MLPSLAVLRWCRPARGPADVGRTVSHLASYDSGRWGVPAGGAVRGEGKPEQRRLRYHRAEPDVTPGARRAGNPRQLQCWSLQVVNCFAVKGEEFLVEIDRLPAMCGGQSSSTGVGLLRTIFYHTVGRAAVARRAKVVRALCSVARSSHDWQYMAVDSFLWLLQDPHTRPKVVERSVLALSDLVEVSRLGEQQARWLWTACWWCGGTKTWELKEARRSLTLLRTLPSIGEEKLMTKADIQAASLVLRLEGGAVTTYNEALEVCPVKARKDRITILNNRAECRLIIGVVVSDTSRAVCLCGVPGSKAQ